jgi:hypothetical protein
VPKNNLGVFLDDFMAFWDNGKMISPIHCSTQN